MQIKRHAKPLDLRPEWPELRHVVIDRGVGRADLRKAVDENALEIERADATLQLRDRRIGILHRQRAECGEAIRPLGDNLGERVIRLAGDLDGLRRFKNALNGVRVERQHCHLDAVCVHLGKPRAKNIEQLAR